MTTTFLHTADWQLGKPYHRVTDIAKRSRIQNERFECLKRIAAAVVENDASFVLIAGDLFDSSSPLDTTVAKACEAIGAMEVPALVIPGNHDHGGPGSLWEQEFFRRQHEQLAPNLRVLLDSEPLVLDTAVILPAPLLRRNETNDPTEWVREVLATDDLPDDRPRIVLAHGSVHGFEATQDDEEGAIVAINRIDLGRLPQAEIDYIALGDWHGTKQVGPKAWYSGTPEIDRFPKGEGNDPGNLLVVRAGRNEAPQVTKVTTGELKWNTFSFHFAGDESLNEFRSRLDEQIGSWGQDSLLRLELSGSLGISASSHLDQFLGDLEARLLRLKQAGQVSIAPNDEEIRALAERPDDPLIASVASQLVEQCEGDDAEVAQLALRELHAACQSVG